MTLTQLCFSFRGRIGRLTFWLYHFAWLFVGYIVGSIANAVGDASMPLVAPIAFVMIYSDFPVVAKRLRDIDRSPWECLLLLIPILGWLAVIPACLFVKSK